VNRVWWVLVLAMAVLSCHGRAAVVGGGLARVRAAGVLRWGGDIQGGEPYVYEDSEHGGRLTGFEVELANALARELGVRAQFAQNDWSALIPTLERGTFDVALNGVEVTPQRVGRVRFTRPYYIFGARLMARRNDPSVQPTLASLRGRRVGTLANSFSYELLRNVAEVVPYEGVEEPYIDLVQGRTDAVLLDDIIAARYGEPKPELRVVGDLADGYYSIALRPADDDLRAALDAALARITASGELERILRGANIFNDRQRRLVTWTDDDQRRMLGTAAAGQRFGWSHVALFGKGALVTLLLSALAMCLAIPLGLGLAVARLYGPRALSRIAGAYVELYRGTPVLLQLYVLYYGLAPIVKLNALSAAVLGLGMNYAAYEAEVYRAGIQAVPRGQMEAALSLGMTTPLALRRVVLPQAFRLALPSVTNDFIALLKDSSLVSVITVVELTKQMTITAVDIRGWGLPGALCALMYFTMSYPLSLLAQRLEARLARS
jgi:polar amino acid transport system substrate-binding protein